MSKKKDKGAAARGVKLPKRIGGVKVPKELRRQGEMAIDRARDAISPQLLASGVAMAATALAARSERAPAPTATTPPAPIDYEEVGRVAGTAVIAAATAMMAMLTRRPE